MQLGSSRVLSTATPCRVLLDARGIIACVLTLQQAGLCEGELGEVGMSKVCSLLAVRWLRGNEAAVKIPFASTRRAVLPLATTPAVRAPLHLPG